MRTLRFTLTLALLAAAALTGCKPDTATRKAETIGESPRTPAATYTPPPDAGTISGTITFSGKISTATIDTTMDPACSLGGAPDHLPVEQIAATAGKLANVFITVKSGPPQAMQAGTRHIPPAVLDQKHCRYVPHVVAIQQGGAVEFRNSDPTMHNIHTMPTTVGNQVIDISQSPLGPAQTKTFPAAETMMPVRCNNHPWMNAFINVAATPFYAVSAPDGTFTITGLPPGAYQLTATHEKLGTQTIPVTVPANATATLQIPFKSN